MSYLISETTREEREQIVKESLGNIEANCDGCNEQGSLGSARVVNQVVDNISEQKELFLQNNRQYKIKIYF